ncbi:class I SAM-dependent methyltransferase [Sinomicrobium pectinilyticum]|uniref:Class I SAM-dependent methyltransferase n=1 Tax=Sinomicrobium pectinilyticum TaxID=1084421 RepID=A0A3N0E2U2_SINP1|nr:class I SAM-dependent methyltransferase [Sinomicrobium pectinilyticum]RNL82151.1 class I SAM-dependent methyltransferase [Sinomicrobium pectinilyticum]
MKTDYTYKSTNEEIRQRFDNDVERFSDLHTGQQSTIDAPVTLEWITEAARSVNPDAHNLLDIGCGAGNYTLKMLSKLPGLNCTLVDLSRPMLKRAEERVREKTNGKIDVFEGDIREVNLPQDHFDIVLAGAVLHHLREDEDWENVFGKIYSLLKPGGSFWISDMVSHDSGAVHAMFWREYGNYLENAGGKDYREKVFAYIEKEDTPRSVTYQTELMKKTGFKTVEILHKNSCFAAFGAIK